MRKLKLSKMKVLMGACLLISGTLFFREQTAYAAEPITIHAVDYEEEEVIINNNNNNKIYFATEMEASKDNWEVMATDSGDYTTIDFSWVSPTTENIIKIKGEDNKQVRVIFPERTRKLEISINYANIASLDKTDSIAPLLNIMSTAGTGEEPIDFYDLEWKKGEGGKWKNIGLLTKGQLEKYQIKGTDLYFRIMAVNDETDYTDPANIDYADGSEGRRACNEVKVKIAKKAAPMVVGIDGEEFTAEIKYGKEYRVTIGSITTDWIKITDRAIRKVPLAKIVNNVADGLTTPFPAMFLEIRDYSTAKTAASKITEISLNEQRTLPGTIIEGTYPEDPTPADRDNIYVSYNGTKNMVLTIPAASTETPYEYCVVKPYDFFDLERVMWSSVTKSTGIKILGSKAVEGGTLYVRQKEIKSREATRTAAAVEYALASTFATHSINYPSIPMMERQSHTYIKGGYSNDITFDVKLNVLNKKPFETKIKNIKLGTRDIDYTYVIDRVIGDPIDTNYEYIMTVTLKKTSLEAMTNCYNRAIAIYYDNGTVDKTSVRLTIKNPTPAYTLTATPAKGTTAGTTTISVVSTVGDGNRLVYTTSSTEVENKNTEDVLTGYTVLTPSLNIPITTDWYVTVYEINSSDQIVKYRSIQITAGYIG